MSPAIRALVLTPARFPRVSGDEPQLRQWGYLLGRFSPRERG